jgi:prepilin-type processing-associated H-X9-DG protein
MIAYGDAMIIPPNTTELIGRSFLSAYGSILPQQNRLLYRALEKRRHGGVFDVVFADGHTEFAKGVKLFSRNPDNLKRWNRDNMRMRIGCQCLALQQSDTTASDVDMLPFSCDSMLPRKW